MMKVSKNLGVPWSEMQRLLFYDVMDLAMVSSERMSLAEELED